IVKLVMEGACQLYEIPHVGLSSNHVGIIISFDSNTEKRCFPYVLEDGENNNKSNCSSELKYQDLKFRVYSKVLSALGYKTGLLVTVPPLNRSEASISLLNSSIHTLATLFQRFLTRAM